jgi:ribonucleoside-diphosphate reductase beta chain
MTEIRLLPPKDLYYLWERQQWRAGAIDFTRDRAQWKALGHEERENLLWNLSQFFVGEQRVTTAFAPIVMAAEDPDEEAYLTTQQVDEARHTQFFARFWDEVLGDDRTALDEQIAGVAQSCNDAFVELFDVRLKDAVNRLRREPSDIDAKVEAITIYHMVVEGTLALTGQHFNTDYLVREGLMPGFVEGFEHVARDEHRHVAYGTWFLKSKCDEDARHAETVRSTLLELLPIASQVLIPPQFAGLPEYEVFGYSSAEIQEFALRALTRRLGIIGIDLAAGEPVPA